jgi:hypothetical protein
MTSAVSTAQWLDLILCNHRNQGFFYSLNVIVELRASSHVSANNLLCRRLLPSSPAGENKHCGVTLEARARTLARATPMLTRSFWMAEIVD